MNATEAAKLCKFAKGACPQQAIDEDTPAAWFVLLNDLHFKDAMEAMVNHLKDNSFVSPAEIRAEVKRIRRARLIAFGAFPDPPAEIGADEVAYRRWRKDVQRQVADGTITSRDQVPQAIKGTRAMPRLERGQNQLPD